MVKVAIQDMFMSEVNYKAEHPVVKERPSVEEKCDEIGLAYHQSTTEFQSNFMAAVAITRLSLEPPYQD